MNGGRQPNQKSNTMKNTTLFILSVLGMLSITRSLSAQNAEDRHCPSGEVNFDMIDCIFRTSKYDFSQKPYYWVFNFGSDSKAQIQQFVDEINKREKTSIVVGISGGIYYCSIEDYKAFTSQSLFDRISSLNRLAGSCQIEEVKCFGLSYKNE